MSSIDRILVATDLSAPASWAETRAGMLAQVHDASIDLLHIASGSLLLGVHEALVGTVGDAEQVVAALRAHVDEAADALERAHRVAVRRHVVAGKPAEQILALARASRSRLIVAGAHGRHPVHRLLFGSTTERLLHRAELPLLIVKRSPQELYRRLLVGVDFSHCVLAASRFATLLAPGAAITLVHVAEAPFEDLKHFAGVSEERLARHRAEALALAESQMAAFLDTAGLTGRAFSRLGYGYPIRALEEEVDRTGPDLLVLGKHGRSVVEGSMAGSVTAHLARTADCDVLVVPGSTD
jgi:nucleotide-binding universal stress UspA family protein